MRKNIYAPFIILVVLSLLALSCSALSGGGSSAQVTSAPAATSTSAASNVSVSLGELKTLKDGGFSFSTAPDYSYEETLGSMVTMIGPGGNQDTGPFISLIGGYNPGVTLQSMMDEIRKSKEAAFSDPKPITVGGVEGLVSEVSTTQKGIELAGRLVMALPYPNQTFTAFGAAEKGKWDKEVGPLFEAVLNSVTFSQVTPPTEIAAPTDEPTLEPTTEQATPEQPTAAPPSGGAEVKQWATSAKASSEYGSEGWAASQATGAPNTPECGDNQTAWASSGSDTKEWIELSYAEPVVPTQVTIYESYNPSQVVKVELLDTQGEYHEIYTAEPQAKDKCPVTLAIDVSGADYQAKAVKISIDQGLLKSWGEIDAVELVGKGVSGSGAAPTQKPSGSGGADGLTWRVGGATGSQPGQFSVIGGMDATADGLIYVSDVNRGVVALDKTGKEVQNFTDQDLFYANDVKVAPDGNLYVSDSSNNEIFVFKPDGTLVTKFGEEGAGDGQFGTFSPKALDVSQDGTLYVLDENEDANGNDYTRVQAFDKSGKYLSSFKIEDDNFSPSALIAGPDGNIYVLGFVGSVILKYSPDGKLLGQIGHDVLTDYAPVGMAMDNQGNFYLSTWTPYDILKLDPQGNKVAQWGAAVDNGDQAWPEGSLYNVIGVAVLPDGSTVFAGDWSGGFAYVTAFQFK